MNSKKRSKSSSTRIWDPETGKRISLEQLIIRLGTEAVARKYGVAVSTVEKWKRRVHRPSRQTLTRSSRKLF